MPGQHLTAFVKLPCLQKTVPLILILFRTKMSCRTSRPTSVGNLPCLVRIQQKQSFCQSEFMDVQCCAAVQCFLKPHHIQAWVARTHACAFLRCASRAVLPFFSIHNVHSLGEPALLAYHYVGRSF
jgi:hypothetical protein